LDDSKAVFERSSQVKEVQCVDERLACISSDVLEQHKENFTSMFPPAIYATLKTRSR
jgi:hypothetical protein